MEFNKKRMLDNISFLLKEKGKKIGELESECGVSAGYISRTAKDNSAKPGIDFVVNAATALGVTVDTLLNYDLASLTPTERYIASFIAKLKVATNDDKLSWKKSHPEYLNNLDCDENGFVDHPLFELEPDVPGQNILHIVFCSIAFGYKTHIAEECFSLKMKDSSTLYLMAISHRDDPTKKAVELWMHKPKVGREYLCGTHSDSTLACLVDDLYLIVKAFSKHPQIDKRLRSVIDAFMADDFEDDPLGGDLPF